MADNVTYEFAPFRFETAGVLSRKDKPIHLTPQEACVLLVLLENAGTVVTKEEFRKKVWPDIDQDVEFDNCLKHVISFLRKALGEKKNSYRYIATRSKRGYVFTARIKISSNRQSFSTKRNLKLVVLPFRSLGRVKQPAYRIDGLTYEIITQLGRLNPERLSVIAPISAMRYKNTKKEIRKIGKELRVSHVLEGEVLSSGNKSRISVQLIHVADESQVWAETYERRLDDIFVLLREVCQDIARKIEVRLVPHEQARLDYLAPIKPEANTSYQKGRYLWNQRNPKALQEATVHFKKAIELDSKFALAHSALADCYAVMASQSWPPREACDNAKLAASRALSLHSTLAEPHAALGFVLSVFEHRWEEAEQEFQEAIRLNANCATAHHWYSFHLAALKRMPEAIEQVKKAQEIDPLSRMINTNVGTMLYWARKYDAAIEQYDQALSLDADFWYAYWMRGLAYDEKKQHREAAADQRRAIKHFPGDSPLLAASLARSLALSGDLRDARRQLTQLKGVARNSSPPHYHIGVALAALGEKDAAFRCLLQSCTAHEMWASFIQVDAKMDALRNDRRYADLERELLF